MASRAPVGRMVSPDGCYPMAMSDPALYPILKSSYGLTFSQVGLITPLGLLLMSRASTYPATLLAAMLIGMGSSIFHPEASRVARMAAGGRYGLAQSLFQVGGNIGSASGPLLAAFVVVPHGQSSIAWFSGAAPGGVWAPPPSASSPTSPASPPSTACAPFSCFWGS